MRASNCFLPVVAQIVDSPMLPESEAEFCIKDSGISDTA
jgi:hypothetical protein